MFRSWSSSAAAASLPAGPPDLPYKDGVGHIRETVGGLRGRSASARSGGGGGGGGGGGSRGSSRERSRERSTFDKDSDADESGSARAREHACARAWHAAARPA